MTTLKKATVIIPAHNRPKHLRRLLDYYSQTDLEIIIPDSSDQIFPLIKDYPQVKYLFRPKLHFLLKIKEIIPLIKTPYVFYCADDDFITPNGIKQMIKFLDNHPDYSSAQGHYLTFTHLGKNIKFTPRYIRHFNKEITGNTPRERLQQEENMYASILYSVIRTDAFIKIYKFAFDNKENPRFSNLFLAEEYFNHAALIIGKHITIPCFYSARERIPNSATDTTIPFSVICNSKEHQEQFNGFLTALSLILHAEEKSNKETTKESSKEEYDFIKYICLKPRDNSQINFKRKILSITKQYHLLKWINILADMRYTHKGMKAIKNMPSYPCSFTTPEKEAIIKAILST